MAARTVPDWPAGTYEGETAERGGVQYTEIRSGFSNELLGERFECPVCGETCRLSYNPQNGRLWFFDWPSWVTWCRHPAVGRVRHVEFRRAA